MILREKWLYFQVLMNEKGKENNEVEKLDDCDCDFQVENLKS